MSANRIRVTDLPGSVSASRFEGEEHGAAVTFTVGDEQVEATGGEILIVPAGTPHGFVNSGSTPLRQISIHPTASMEAEWLD